MYIVASLFFHPLAYRFLSYSAKSFHCYSRLLSWQSRADAHSMEERNLQSFYADQMVVAQVSQYTASRWMHWIWDKLVKVPHHNEKSSLPEWQFLSLPDGLMYRSNKIKCGGGCTLGLIKYILCWILMNCPPLPPAPEPEHLIYPGIIQEAKKSKLDLGSLNHTF